MWRSDRWKDYELIDCSRGEKLERWGDQLLVRPDPQAMMRQVQKMQDEIRAKQAELEAREYTGSASGEMVTVTMTGKHEVTAVKIKPEAVDPDDIEMLEDLIAAAVNSACAAVDKDSDEEMSKMTGGMNIPGLG